MRIAVLGGGFTGLSAAFHLSYRFPAAQIWLFERGSRLGGWARSSHVPLGETVLLEGGPRTLRPQGASVLELVRHLGIEDQMITVPKSSPAAKNRYIYVPPGQLDGVSGLQIVGPDLSSPLMRKFLWPIIRAPFRYALRKNATGGEDESVHSFASRILGEDMATVVGSAVMHGIYAADSRKLSARSVLPFWSPSSRNKFLTDPESSIEEDVCQPLPNIGNLGETLKDTAVYSFKAGLATIPREIEHRLKKRSNVQLFLGSSVLSLLMRKDHTFELSYLNPHNGNTSISTINPTHVVSALSLPALHSITQPTSPSQTTSTTLLSPIPHLTQNTSSTVHVLNLIFPHPPSQIHPQGFGYLIPRPRSGYPSTATDATPGILGVVFDSCSVSQQDSSSSSNMSPEEYYHRGPYTKITVMLGGPYPLYIPPSTPSEPEPTTPSTTTKELPHAIRVILNHVATHLGKSALPDPVYYKVWRNEECIPTYSVGHQERVGEIREVLEGGWRGKLEVVGAGVDGVSVPDCVLAGRNAGLKWL